MVRAARILVIDDELAVRQVTCAFLLRMGYDVCAADSAEGAREAFVREAPDGVVLDFQLPDGTALDLLPVFRAADPSVPIIILTGHASIDLAVRCIKEGAENFLTKPLELPALAVLLERALEQQHSRRRQHLDTVRQSRDTTDIFLGTSAAIRRLERDAQSAARSSSPVMLLGETGAGKGVLARWLHANGPRHDEAFIDINCAGLSRELLESELFGHEKGAFTGAIASKAGLLEVAHKGTFFMDEIGDMDLSLQPKLLKVLEEKQFRRVGDVRERRVDIRLISATHQDLEALVVQQRFRADLFFRVCTVPIRVPPLRERREDIVPLARMFLNRLGGELARPGAELAVDACRALEDYDWPGNVRELRNVLERALLFHEGPLLGAAVLRLSAPQRPAAAGDAPSPDLDLSLAQVERNHVVRVLRSEQGHVERTARRLDVPRSTLYQKLQRYDIDPKALPPG